MALTVMRDAVLLSGLLTSALMAGFFYTYSVSVMPGLDAIDPLSATRAMQGINAVIRIPVFAAGFFGALLFPLVASLLAWIGHRRRVALLTLLSATVYLVGVFTVTLLMNVPMNEALAGINPTTETSSAVWSSYAQPWTAWNHVRTLSAIAAFGFSVAAVVLEYRQ
jgi:uncharacterized membrane protein